MPILLTDKNSTIEDKGEIMVEIKCFYTKLYTSKGSLLEILVAWEELLSYISTSITKAQQLKIKVAPTSKEVKSILKQLPKSKLRALTR